ncbi:NAD(P)/FAD-dependent oxidoreductase [Actinomadura sp. KC06]|uniref:FAD-dependent oxidoreductase n=1 Tax=Actinomadura sp. KC06 TaxID=2530369 RepID=UPI0010511BE5|nr:FAD-dependent oxidoreductase [Actinomadura sp. KC06]TDD34168.1 NAD(P)/FAD-dependent oxidoreductase [Actinomadura sp. KC06]
MGTTTISSGEPNVERIWDSVIVGGGAPGAHMHGYLPSGFQAAGQEELFGYGASIVQATVAEAERATDGTFVLRLADGSIVRGRWLLVAMGLTDELPDILGLTERWASAVHQCPHRHGYDVGDHQIAVIGSTVGAWSVHLAALMRRHSTSAMLCVNEADLEGTERQRLTAYDVNVLDVQEERVSTRAPARDGDPSVIVEMDTGTSLRCEAIFVAPRPVPHEAILTTSDVQADPASGLVTVDASGAMSVEGLWAAGNVVDQRAQVVTAAGAGSGAGIAMSSRLLESELSGSVTAFGGEG